MPRFKHRDITSNSTSSSFSSRHISSRLRVGCSTSSLATDTDESSRREETSTSNTCSNDDQGRIGSSESESQIGSTMSSSNDSQITITQSNHLSNVNQDFDDDNEFSFDFDDDSRSPPKAIIWKDTTANHTSDEVETIDNDSHGLQSLSLSTPKKIHPSSILRQQSSSSSPVSSPIKVATSPSLLNSSKKTPKVTFGEDVKFRQKTPVAKVKRITKKKPLLTKSNDNAAKSSRLITNSSSTRRKLVKSTAAHIIHNLDNVASPISSSSRDSSSSASIQAIVTPTSNENNTTSSPNFLFTNQSSQSHSSSSPSIISWMPNRGLGIDSRVLETFSGDAIGRTFQKYVLEFLKSCSTRGLCPNFLATTTFKDNTKKQYGSRGIISNSHVRDGSRMVGNNVIESKAIHLQSYDVLQYDKSDDSLRKDTCSLIPLVRIKPPSNIGNTKNRNVVHVPRRLLASDSWKIFGDLVESILSKQQSSNCSSNNSTPIEVTIISNDVAFFTDVNVDSHKRALARLWERLRPKFESNLIRSMNVIIFESKITAFDLSSNANVTADYDVRIDTSKQSDEQHVNGKEDIDEDSDDDVADNVDHTPHRFKVALCVREIQNYIVKLSEKEFKQLKDGYSQTRKGMPVSVQFETKEFHPIHFSSVSQQWSREILHSATSDYGHVCFDLPETFDGTQTAIMLNLSYSILPYRLDSSMAKNLLDDLRSLSESFVEVVQLIPLDCVDLSLMYGTPLTAKPGMGGDIDQYKQMQVLVRALFDYLGSNDVALALRSTKAEETTSCSSDGGSRLYLLMAQVEDKDSEERRVSDEKTQFKAVGRGVLYQYVDRAEHVVEEPTEHECNEHGGRGDHEELIAFSNNYISESLGLLDCLELSPFDNRRNSRGEVELLSEDTVIAIKAVASGMSESSPLLHRREIELDSNHNNFYDVDP